jgi:RimJ/RimL family protein N-acetyltransferase
MLRRFESPGKPTLEHTRGVMRRWMAERAAGAPAFVYALRDGAGTLMGGCELRPLTATNANVSYWLYPPFRGRGFAARALRLLGEAARGVEGLRVLEAHIDPDNAASVRVATACGYEPAGEVEEESWTGERFVRLILTRDL